MKLEWHEWPLMLFTVLGQCAVGGFIVLALTLLCSKTTPTQRDAIHKNMVFIWVMMGVAFLASMMHLGSIGRAFNALNQIGSSALSNEIALGSAFFAIGGLYWLAAVMNKVPEAASKAWLIVAMLAGVAFIYAMGRVYQIETVPTWDSGYTMVNFFLTMIIGGTLLGCLLKTNVCSCGGKGLAIVAVVAFIISAGCALMQSSDLAGIQSSVVSATALVDFGTLMATRLMLVAVGLGLWIAPMLSGKRASVIALALGFGLVVCGELIGRAVFYNLHMTVGVTFGG